MSILRKPYEISVWEDSLEGGKLKEKKIATIGSDTMQFMGRALEPNLNRKANGEKKFSFKMYKRYIDTITGEEVENPLSDLLVSERKVKLKYRGKWFDFVIKDINETSTNYLYSYQLEDALVKELSRNGFGVTLDEKLQNNMNTIDGLGNTVLEGTDWTISNKSDKFVEKIEEALVYLTVDGVPCTKIADPEDGKLIEKTAEETVSGTVLAFYSCCTGKPYRFQFIKLNNYADDKVCLDSKGVIDTTKHSNCQYYVDKRSYASADNGMYLPSGFSLQKNPGNGDTTISHKYRGARYGFAQSGEYVPLLDRYCSKFANGHIEYYGYLDSEYTSPVQVQDVITNPDFKGTSGWVGTHINNTNDAASSDADVKVESVYGRFVGNKFVSVVEDMQKDNYSEDNGYTSYLRIKVPSSSYTPVLINTGFFDKRISTKNVAHGETWVLEQEIFTEQGASAGAFNCCLADIEYIPATDAYKIKEPWTGSSNDNLVITHANISDKEFKNKKIKLLIYPSAGTYYIKKMSLYRGVLGADNEFMEPGNANTSGIVNTKYRLVAVANTKAATDIEDLVFDEVSVDSIYSKYTPVFNNGAEMVRSVSAKESNYFNILQSLAEKFGAWLDFEIGRDADGAITSKAILFKKNIGKKNYAAFRYGVNLKDIQRTYASKEIVTKLIVKQNSNKYGENGFCTIARADSNPTGDNCIYDFRYYFLEEMLDENDFNTVYGKAGYYERIKKLNKQIVSSNELISGIMADLVKLNAEKTIQDGLIEAANSSMEEVNEDFELYNEVSILSSFGQEILTTEKNEKLVTEYATYSGQKKNAEAKSADLSEQISKKEAALTSEKGTLKAAQESKAEADKAFYSKYAQFIQEGTWISEEYVDDNKYYADALQTMYNSCFPKTAYSINVLELSQLPGYEMFDFDLGDTTYVEDPEFFGNERRVEVAITEMMENLDDPSKNNIKVQTFKDQFQDLFQKITATVQQAQYSEGSYGKAVALAEANAQQKGQFLSDALDGMSSKLSVAGQTTVDIGVNGITLTDSETNDQMRLIGGAILMSVQDDETGERKWKTGLTPEGISASLVTAGTLNAGEISIMNGRDAAFRWDSFGISAFDQTDSGVNNNKFVRFDKHGIYGITGKDGTNWRPSAEQDIKDNASYYLTWDGLKVTPENQTYTEAYDRDGNKIEGITSKFSTKHFATLGRAGDYVYNTWNEETGLPYYDKSKEEENRAFVKMFAVGDQVGASRNEEFVLYTDGTLVTNNIKLTGSIQWTDSSSPSKNVYGRRDDAGEVPPIPGKGEQYGSFPESTGPWHKFVQENPKDTHYCHTDNGGATWQGPFLITGLSIDSTVFEYQILESGLTTEKLDKIPENETDTRQWSTTIPDTTTMNNKQSLYIRVYDIYNDGSKSPYRYLSSAPPVADLTLVASTLVVQEDQNGNLTPAKIELTATAQALHDSDGKYEWIGIEETPYTDASNTATFTTEGMNESHTITVKYGDASDSVTIIRVKEGSDAISAILTNPTMVFNKTQSDLSEQTSVLVYRGSEAIPYGAASTNSHGWYYTLREKDEKEWVGINDGLITVTNPQKNESIPIILTIHKGSLGEEEKTLSIACIMIEDAYHIELSNDNDVIAVANGNPIGLPIKVSAKAYVGGTDISDIEDSKWSISPPNSDWTSKHYTFSDKTLSIEGLPKDVESGQFTFTWTKGDTSLSKVFSFTTVVSDVDWNLLFDKWVINTNESEANRTVNFIIEKVDNKARTKYDSWDKIKDLDVKVQYRNGIGWTDITKSSMVLTGAQQFQLVQKKDDKAIKAGFVWDTEEVGAVCNGFSIKRINTYERTDITENDVRDTYGKVDTTEDWWVEDTNGTVYNNDHINVGDTAYVSGTTSDTGLSYAIYGIVLEKGVVSQGREAIKLKTSYYVMTGSKGDMGKIALSPIKVFTTAYSVNDTRSGNYTNDLNRTPQVGECFSSLCNGGENIATFKITSVSTSNGTYTATVISVTSLKGNQGLPALSIELSNDSATIFADKDGGVNNSVLQTASTTTVIVKSGESDLSSSCSYSWTCTGGTLANNNQKTTYFTALSADTATATVTVSYSSSVIGTKTFTISKQKTGATGASGFAYRLYLSPNSWNTSVNASQTITFTAHKIAPEGISTLTLASDNGQEYYVRKQGTDVALGGQATIEGTTTFELVYNKNSAKKAVDTETVSAFRNGDNGTGTKGDTAGTVTAYINNSTQLFNGKPGETLSGDWTLTEPTPTPEKIYVWACTGNFVKPDGGTATYSNWTSPTLHAAYSTYGIDYKKYAQYLAATDFERKETLDYGSDGKLYINASYINTGALTVKKGGTGTDKDAVVFSAGWDDTGKGIVNLARWTVTNDRLTNGTIGASGSFGIYPDGIASSNLNNSFVWKDSLASDDAWVMSAGNSFGITKNGKLYADSGQIGGMTIEGLSDKIDQISGDNLLHNTSNSRASNNSSSWIYPTDGSKWKAGDYAVSFSLDFSSLNDANKNNLDSIVVYTRTDRANSWHKQTKISIKDYLDSGNEKKFSGVIKLDSETTIVDVRFQAVNSSEAEYGTTNLYMKEAKVEKGAIATAWRTASTEYLKATESTSSYRWKFSPKDGVSMSKGSTEVFGVDEEGLFVNGTIIADTGEIGCVGIFENYLEGETWRLDKNTLSFSAGASAISLDGTVFGSSGNKVAYIKTQGSFSITSSDGIGIRIGTTVSGLTVKVTELKYGHMSSTASVKLTLSPAPTKKFTLYWFKYNTKGRNESGSIEFSADSYTRVFETEFGMTDASGDDYVGFSVSSIVEAREQAYGKGYGIKYGTSPLKTMPINGDTIKETSQATDISVICIGDFIPEASTNRKLGSSGNQWADVWCQDGAFNGSDRNLKKDISPFDYKYERIFDELQPKQYKWIQNTSNRTHTGFIAQEVEDAVLSAGLTTQDFAAIAKYAKEDGSTGYSLRYTEFIALNTWQIQKLKPRVSTLEQTILDYETRISSLEREVENLKSV